jgi:DNA-binding CsgD family transcriptional regulator
MAAMSLATDIGMGQPLEQGLGICLLSVRFGEQLGLADAELQRVYDVALLRHIGCTAEAAAFADIMADELVERFCGAAGPLLGSLHEDSLWELARGLSIRQIAAALTIAPKTADAHIQHIYAKAGVSTRAAATMFAMQHDLVD